MSDVCIIIQNPEEVKREKEKKPTYFDSAEWVVLFLRLYFIFTLCVRVFCLLVCLHTPGVQCPSRPEESVGYSGTRVRDSGAPTHVAPMAGN